MRLDLFLVQYKSIESRTKAQDLIEAGFVYLNQQQLKKPSYEVSEAQANQITILENDFSKYVSRAGFKLEGALKRTGLIVKNQLVFDVGQSTGGFTDCLLQLGAKRIVGIDVGSGQLHEKIKTNPSVTFLENANVKDLASNQNFQTILGQQLFDVAVCDVSFISLTKVVQFIEPYLKPNGYFLFLVKPQFECGPEYLDKNGIVDDAKVYKLIEAQISNHCEKIFHNKTEFFESSITGKDGNKEFFIYGQKLKV